MLLLFVVPSRQCSRCCRCHRRTTNASIAGRRHCCSHRRHLCRCNHICFSLRRRPHLAAAFTDIVDAVVTAASPTQFPSAQPSQAIAIATATAVVAAVAVALAAAIAAAITLASAVTIAAASTNVSAAVVIVVVVVVVVIVVVVVVVVVVADAVVIATVAYDLTAAYAAAIALASAVAAATALIAVAVFALRCSAVKLGRT